MVLLGSIEGMERRALTSWKRWGARLTRNIKPKVARPLRSGLLKFVEGLILPHSLLGLTHITTSYSLRDVLAAGQIAPEEPCEVLGENVTYAFYGRAAFRSGTDFSPTTLSSLVPTVLVLDPRKVPEPKYVLPFDSGAFVAGRMDGFLHPYMPLFDFLLAPTTSSAAKLVNAVFGSNENYLLNKARGDFEVPNGDFEAESYRKIVLNSGMGADGLDDRAATPELIFDKAIPVKDSVVAAVIPDCLSLDEAIGGVLRGSKVEIYDYPWTSASRPNEYHFVIRQLVQTIYKKQGWL